MLSVLREYNARATFFYVGDNITKYPDLFKQAFEGGHSIGNHTFNHLKAWKTGRTTYLSNVEMCEQAIRAHGDGSTKQLFRPPYGQLSYSLAKTIAARYKLVMWDYLTGDFDQSLSPEDCHKGAIQQAGEGSIVTYHENIKAEARIRYSLPLFLDHFSKLGFQFCAIE